MAKYADLDRRRQEHILVNHAANSLALDALARATGLSLEHWTSEIGQSANTHMDKWNEAQIDKAIANLDAQYD